MLVLATRNSRKTILHSGVGDHASCLVMAKKTPEEEQLGMEQNVSAWMTRMDGLRAKQTSCILPVDKC